MTLTLMPAAMASVIAGRPATVAGILISALGRSTSDAQLLGLRERSRRCVGEARVDLDGDPAVLAAGGLVDRKQDVAGVADVLGDQRETASSTVDPAAARSRICSS